MNIPVEQISFWPQTTARNIKRYRISTTPEVEAALVTDAVVAFGISGGKDSIAGALRMDSYLNSIGHAGPRVLIHADLGSLENSIFCNFLHHFLQTNGK